MAQWKWEGIDKDGRPVQGNFNVANEREVRKLLRAQGVRPKKIIPPSILEFDLTEWLVEHGIASSYGTKDLMHFTKQLSTMIGAGVPIIQALEILYKTEKNLKLKLAIKNVAAQVSEGKTVADALSGQRGFDKLYCNLVKAGEAGGILDSILKKLAEYLERQEKIKSQIKSAMAYPAIVIVVGIGVVWGLMVFVVPTFVGMLAETNQELPWITKFVMETSHFFQQWTSVMLPAFFIGVMFLNAWRKSKEGKPIFDRFVMNLPLFGGIVVKGNLASFSRTIATMLGAGVPLIDALDICIETIDNGVISNDLKKVRKEIVQGKTITEPLLKIPYFPTMVAQMVKIGEQTGSVDQMFIRVSEVFEEEVDELVGRATKMIEPLIIVVLGGVVAVILVAMYLPIFLSAGAAG